MTTRKLKGSQFFMLGHGLAKAYDLICKHQTANSHQEETQEKKSQSQSSHFLFWQDVGSQIPE